jgi:Mn2+/Fe2+ NRAMP family transporter
MRRSMLLQEHWLPVTQVTERPDATAVPSQPARRVERCPFRTASRMGRTRLAQRRGATDAELRKSRWDVVGGMFFSNLIMYLIMLSTGATLYAAGTTDVDSAARAAEALRPLAGFALGIVAVGFLAVPVMTTWAAYDLSQSLGWKQTLQTG